ncbi:DinB superfamily protein [Rosistilla ulvae]|uniref:DinB superfamily protein n=1 Tax=Rosistilla ulvae TaxID=1930277 RepID=A0A517LUK4_9BACT|nr:DinB family protein [Rosistilla ulvae]QDS86302.1 DinB superfamily protein [Rosistilla ulvae]
MNLAMPLIEDLKDHSLAFPTPKGGNHALWVTGHITFTLAWVIDVFLQGKPNRLEHWKSLFDTGTEPVADPEHYPPFDELLQTCKACHRECMDLLDSMHEGELDEKVNCPEGFESFVGTKRLCFRTAANHWLLHLGQLADTRRSLARKPLMA